MSRSKIFNIDFDMLDYKSILPDGREYLKHDFIINYDEQNKGNIEKCFWEKHIPTVEEIKSPEFRQREITRMTKTGVLIAIKEEIVWIPPNYYFGLQYGMVGEEPLQFRLKRLKQVYHKIIARKNPHCKGTLTLKNRADGETTSAIIDGLWECHDGNLNVGMIGIQSKTRDDAQNPCWSTLQVLWQSLPKWIKQHLYSDMTSGTHLAEKMQFMREAQDTKPARNITLKYYPCVYNAMDGRHNMRRCILDEVCKWKEAGFYDTFTNYSKFIMPGLQRRGIFDMFSSPADAPCKSNEEVYALWKESQMTQINEKTGSTNSGIHAYYSNPLEGIQNAYDKYGDVDPQEIYDHIMRIRKATPKDKLMGEIRGFPLNENEMFSSMDASSVWSNQEGIKERRIYLLGRRYKDDETKEPIKIFGNLEREGGYSDGDVVFRMHDTDKFDVDKARFCFSYLPQDKEPLSDIFRPPSYVENVIGVDPFAKRHVKATTKSNGAIVNYKFMDVHGTGVINCPTMVYSNRPQHPATFYEDVLKSAIFNRARIQYENVTAGLGEYIEDRGYEKWLLPSKGQREGSKLTGDSPTGRGSLINEMIALADNALNLPIHPDDDYPLERYWFDDMLEDLSNFNPLDTHKSDISMSFMQALLGRVKLIHMKRRKPSSLNSSMVRFITG